MSIFTSLREQLELDNEYFSSPSYSPLESPLETKTFDYLQLFGECVYCINDMLEVIDCVNSLVENTASKCHFVEEEDKSTIVFKKIPKKPKTKNSFFIIDHNDDLDLFLKLKKKVEAPACNLVDSFNEKNNEIVNENMDKYFHQFKVYFFNLIKTYLNSIKFYKIENKNELTCDTAKVYLNSYLNGNSSSIANDTDLCCLIMINLCLMVLDLLYNCSFNTVIWFIDTINENYKNLIKGW
jgi:hypothetical protein